MLDSKWNGQLDSANETVMLSGSEWDIARYLHLRRRKKNLFATNNNDIKQEKQRNNTEVSS